MSHRSCNESDYIEFLLAAQTAFGCVEASRTSPAALGSVSHDAYTRLLTRRPLDTEALWNEAQRVVGQAPLQGGLLVLDDTTLDKPYSQKIELVSRHWSGKHGRVVSGINLLSLVWTAGYTLQQSQLKHKHEAKSAEAKSAEAKSAEAKSAKAKSAEAKSAEVPLPAVVPCDFRVYDQNADANGQHKTKNDHFRDLLQKARERGFAPQYVAFDSWYSGLDNLKKVRALEWLFLTRLKANRTVNLNQSGQVPVSSLCVGSQGQEVWLKGFGLVRLFQKTRPGGEVEHWITNDLEMTKETWTRLALSCWAIETYHRGLKSCCGIERAQVRSANGQKNHLLLALRAFLRLEYQRLQNGISWYEAKLRPLRNAIQAARTAAYKLPNTA